jgi:hypothetical protein
MDSYVLLFVLLTTSPAGERADVYVLDTDQTAADCAAVLDRFAVMPDGTMLSPRPGFVLACETTAAFEAAEAEALRQ